MPPIMPIMNSSADPTSRRHTEWIKRVLPNAQAVSLAAMLLVSFLLIYWLSDLLMPVFAAIVIAYLLDGVVVNTLLKHLPRRYGVLVVFASFMGFVLYLLLDVLPILYQQAAELVQHLPDMIRSAQSGIMRLPELYPEYITEQDIRNIMMSMQDELLRGSQRVLSFSAASVVGLITALVYLVLVPMLVFFLLKDKSLLVGWLEQFVPRDRNLIIRVWREVDIQLGNYVRGKLIEVFILWSASYITFAALNLNYSMLLAVLMGLSVIIPYIGATLVTFPVVGVAYFQWGTSDPFLYCLIAYTVIQVLDGVLLVPLLFSEAVNLHPVAIITAILFFGGLWGFWGVFFAIPLATLVKAVLTAWPRELPASMA